MQNDPYRTAVEDETLRELKRLDSRVSYLEKTEISSRTLNDNENKMLAIIRSTEFLVIMFCVCLIISGIFDQLNLDKIVHVFHATCFVFIVLSTKRLVQS